MTLTLKGYTGNNSVPAMHKGLQETLSALHPLIQKQQAKNLVEFFM
jgi:hypothetical protein